MKRRKDTKSEKPEEGNERDERIKDWKTQMLRCKGIDEWETSKNERGVRRWTSSKIGDGARKKKTWGKKNEAEEEMVRKKGMCWGKTGKEQKSPRTNWIKGGGKGERRQPEIFDCNAFLWNFIQGSWSKSLQLQLQTHQMQ